jgi:Uncharacterized protein conserved in bacteria
VLTVNQPGAGGGISARVASQAAPDGYTLYMPATSPFLALPGAPGVAPNLPLELPRDFAPIGFILQQPLFIGASHKSGIQHRRADRTREGEARRDQLCSDRARSAVASHHGAAAGARRIKVQLVPYVGGPAQAMSDVLEGRVQLCSTLTQDWPRRSRAT